MNEKVKEIVSSYLKISPESLQAETVIGRSALVNSIMVHRMYAALSKEGFAVDNFQEIRTFGDLLNKIQGTDPQTRVPIFEQIKSNRDSSPGIGIDIEEIANFPATIDFREDDFYLLNFTVNEIAYCGIQPEPYASFAGLFAVKEAIVKADNSYKNIPFNKIFLLPCQFTKSCASYITFPFSRIS